MQTNWYSMIWLVFQQWLDSVKAENIRIMNPAKNPYSRNADGPMEFAAVNCDQRSKIQEWSDGILHSRQDRS